MVRFWATAFVVSLVLQGCGSKTRHDGQARQGEEEAVDAQQEELARLAVEHEACRAMRKNIETLPRLVGTPELDKIRHRVLGHAKGWPVVFRRAPSRDTMHLDPYFRDLAESLDDPRRAFSALSKLRKQAWYRRQTVRSILMPEGYLYADQPELARWLVTLLDLPRLFDEQELWLMRGSSVFRLVRDGGEYRYADGPQEGSSASLLLFDRVMLDAQDLQPVLHVDFVPSAEAKGFDRIRIERMTPAGINAKIRYGSEEHWVDAVFTTEESRAQLACEIVGAKERPNIDAFRKERRIGELAAIQIRQAVEKQVSERLMFDEPREEVGQQDGSLRPLWLWAYRQGSDGYRFNDIRYPVFDRQGRAHPPQVCIDFVLDTYERAAGTWYGGSETRQKTVGTVDFEKFDIPNRRSVEAVANYFRENPGTFSIWDLPAEERIQFARHHEFYDYIRDHADRFRINNVVLIHGPRGREAHYHSFIVSRTDPMTGMPVEVSENAGKPRLRSWHAAMQSAPLRSIRNVMIPDMLWLRRAYGSSDGTVALVGVAVGEVD